MTSNVFKNLTMLMTEQPPRRGDIDAVVVFHIELVDSASEAAHALLGFIEEGAKPFFKRVHVAWHADIDVSAQVLRTKVEKLVLEAMLASDASLPEDAETRVRNGLFDTILCHSETLVSIEDALAWWSSLPDGDACMILGAGCLMDRAEQPPEKALAIGDTPLGDKLRHVSIEEVRVPRIIGLAEGIRKRQEDRKRSAYTILFTCFGPISNDVLRSELSEHVDLLANSAEPLLASALAQVPHWIDQARQGDHERALDEIAEAVPDPDFRAQLSMQVLSGAGLDHDAWALASPFLSRWRGGDPASILQLARTALHAGDIAIVEELFDELDERMPVELTSLINFYELAKHIGREERAQEVLAKLRKLAPAHRKVERFLLDDALERQDWDQARAIATAPHSTLDPEHRHFIGVRAECELGTMSEHIMLEYVGQHLPNYEPNARRVIAMRALERGDAHSAVRHLDPTENHINAWLKIYEHLCNNQDGDLALEDQALGTIVRVLAEQPTNTKLRKRLTTLFAEGQSRDRAEGWALEQFTNLITDEALSPPDRPSESEPETFMSLIKRALERHRGQAVKLVPPERLPRDMRPSDPVGFYWAIYKLFRNDWDDPAEIRAAFFPLKLGLDITLELGDDGGHRGLDLIWHFAANLALTQNFQDARNYAEELLELAAYYEDPALNRIAWLHYADIYLRCHNPREATLAISCALSLDSKAMRASDHLFALDVAVRLSRTLGIDDLALALLEPMARTSDVGQQLKARHLRLSIVLSQPESMNPVTLLQLLNQGSALLRDSLTHRMELLPPLIVVMQARRFWEELGQSTPPSVNETIAEALESLSPGQRTRVLELTYGATLGTLVERAQRLLDRTAYVEDLAWDRHELDLLARRSLLVAADGDDTSAAFVILELLADFSYHAERRSRHKRLKDRVEDGHRELVRRGARLSHRLAEFLREPTGRARSPAASLFGDVNRLAAELDSWVTDGMEIHALGADDMGRFVHVRKTKSEGQIIEKLLRKTLSRRRLTEWSRQYPQGLVRASSDQRTRSEFIEIMTGLGISHLAEDESRLSVFMTSVDLTSVPLNLLLRGGMLAGENGPLTRVPSLAWLMNRRSDTDTVFEGERLWLLGSSANDDDTLGMLRLELPVALAQTGVELVTNPDTLNRSSLAVVVAHGDLDSEQGQILRVFGGDGEYSPHDISLLLADSKVVILLICGGGRVDPAPLATTTTGLPRTLLDQGVHAVIASPWLLDAKFALQWIGRFIRLYQGEIPIARAVFEANLASREVFESPAHWLAMHLFGDPMITR